MTIDTPSPQRSADSDRQATREALARLGLPEVAIPFEVRASPYGSYAEEHTIAWLRDKGIITDTAQELRCRGFGCAVLVAYNAPFFDRDQLAELFDWYLWFFLLDDRWFDANARPRDLARMLAS